MNILGIGGYSHDSAAALVCDGQLIAAVAEERLSRIKHQGGCPERAVEFCLEQAGITRDEVDHIGVYMQPLKRVLRRLPYRAKQMLRAPAYSAAYMAYEIFHNARFAAEMRGLRGAKTKLHFMEHHPAHAASAFLVSPFERAALLSVDYIGEWASTWSGYGEGTNIRSESTIAYPHSLGVFYSAITDYLGFLRASDEYKVMGLASYGEPEFAEEFRKIVRSSNGSGYRIDLSYMTYHYKPGSRCGYMSRKFTDRFGPRRHKSEAVETRHQNIAASAQLVLEEAVLDLCHALHKRTGATDLCMAGGVALNCSMNGRLKRESPFERIFIQPASGDDGIAIGAAFQLHHRMTGAPRDFVLRDVRLGPEHANGSVKRALDIAKISYEKPDNLEERTAELLADGQIVGWYQGAMEFGPRALGARSILADPTRADMKDQINKYVKHREEFRPFAPSCLQERAHEFFEDCDDSPFMLFVHRVRPEKRDAVPAITHIDGTARVQTVSRDAMPQYHRLIEAFERKRGVPMLLNTSFNVMGEPIVNTPEDALRCFFSTGLDALAIGDYIVEKNPVVRKQS